MDEGHLEAVRTEYARALEQLRETARDAEREIGGEALILLGLHGSKTSHHFFGSQFGSRTWMYAMYLHDQSRTVHFQVALGPNDRPTPVAGPNAEPERMAIFLEDAPALLHHIRQRVQEIHGNISGADAA